MKKQMANGSSFSSHFDSSTATARRHSEPPPHSSNSFQKSSILHVLPQTAKDDAYEYFARQGRKGTSPQHVGQTASSHFDARQLLDPGRSGGMKPPSPPPKNPSAVNGHKRDVDEYESQGMGSLIERVHNVSGREERPQKKQKSTETFEDDTDKKPIYGGGGKGGEIGEYMRQKKQEGIAESGVASIVDLTGGKYFTFRKVFTLTCGQGRKRRLSLSVTVNKKKSAMDVLAKPECMLTSFLLPLARPCI